MKLPSPFVLLLTLLVVSFCACAEEGDSSQTRGDVSQVEAYDLRCEMRIDPLGVDTARPRLSWKLRSKERGQRASAYRIVVATGGDSPIEERAARIWDSGKVEVGRALQIEYGGPGLASRQRCRWSLKVWDAEGRASDWSRPARWEMGLLKPDDWQGQWIDDGKKAPEKDEEHYLDDPAPWMRREFELGEEIARARLHISGLGYYEASINGERVGDRVLDPIWTDYDKRVFYSSYDVTSLLRRGQNVLGVVLGNGWYNPLPIRMWGHLNLREHLPIGRPCLIAQLEVEFSDGRRQIVATDESWRQSEGPLLRHNIYLGEVYDARREIPGWDTASFDAQDWRPVAFAPGPKGRLQAQPLPPIRITAELKPVALTEPTPGTHIFDFGQNFAGWARLSVQGPAGTKVQMRFAELLHADGTLNPMTSVCGQVKAAGRGGPGAPDVAVQSATYILKGGEPETYTPRFSFQAFRYVEVTGLPGPRPLQSLRGLRLACDVEEIGSFQSSDETLNRIHAMVRATFLSNLFGVQSDCPHRERFGYGGDIVATTDAYFSNLDMSSFYPKVVLDLADSVSKNGVFAMTAPEVGIAYAGLEDGDGPIGWSLAHPLLVRELHRHYGDRRVVETQYEAVRRWLSYLETRSPDFLVEKGLSDHESLVKKPVRESSTAFYFAAARISAELATILGRKDAATKLEALAENIRAAFAREFVAPTTGVVGIGSQAAQAIALAHGLVPTEVEDLAFARLVDLVSEEDPKLDTGIFGTQALLEVLSRKGRSDLAYRLATRKEFPGWGHMLEMGATTLWEHWKLSENVFSHNHPMFGSVSGWMFRWLAGIAPAPDAVGFDLVLLRAQPVEGLTWVEGSIETGRGKIISRWRVEDDQLSWTIELPPGVTGEVTLPKGFDASAATESGLALAKAPGVEMLAKGRYRIASGRYVFRVPRG